MGLCLRAVDDAGSGRRRRSLRGLTDGVRRRRRRVRVAAAASRCQTNAQNHYPASSIPSLNSHGPLPIHVPVFCPFTHSRQTLIRKSLMEPGSLSSSERKHYLSQHVPFGVASLPDCPAPPRKSGVSKRRTGSTQHGTPRLTHPKPALDLIRGWKSILSERKLTIFQAKPIPQSAACVISGCGAPDALLRLSP